MSGLAARSARLAQVLFCVSVPSSAWAETALPAPATQAAAAAPAATPSSPAAEAPDAFYGGGATTESTSEASDSPVLDLYGFMDFTYTKNLDGNDVPYAKFPHFGTFGVGNVNLYAASNLGHGWRSLLEVRFLYLPDGADQAFTANGSVARTDDSTSDYADFQRQLRWGGIEIQRALLEYQASEWLAIQMGQYLTPYGIWNLDHGSPTVIPVRRPFVIGENLFPAHQTGLEAHGSFHVDATTFGYHLTFSNGKGPIDTYLDLDSNNALGARAFVRNTSFGTLTLGASAFTGKYTNRSKSYAPKPGVTPTQLEIHDDIVTQYDEVVFGADLRWEWNNLLLQGEVIADQRNYVDPYRRVDASGVVPDEFNFGGYGLLGYRTPWLGVMPYVMGEYYNFQVNALFPPAISSVFGLNVRPQANVVFKLQYQYVQFGDLESREALRGTLHQADAQAAWAF